MIDAKDFFAGPDRALIEARCARCGRHVGVYWIDESASQGEWIFRFRACTCTPAPRLPAGEQLEKLIDRGRRARHTDDVTHAPVKIRIA
jgi:hypothetical protein